MRGFTRLWTPSTQELLMLYLHQAVSRDLLWPLHGTVTSLDLPVVISYALTDRRILYVYRLVVMTEEQLQTRGFTTDDIRLVQRALKRKKLRLHMKLHWSLWDMMEIGKIPYGPEYYRDTIGRLVRYSQWKKVNRATHHLIEAQQRVIKLRIETHRRGQSTFVWPMGEDEFGLMTFHSMSIMAL